MNRLPNVHPGEVLLEEFLKPHRISQSQAARDLNVPPRRISDLVHGKRAITADTALRLAHYFRYVGAVLDGTPSRTTTWKRHG